MARTQNKMDLIMTSSHLYEKYKHHNGQQYVTDIQMDVSVLYPAQPVEQPQNRIDHHTHHVKLGYVIDMAMVMGFLGKPTANCRMIDPIYARVNGENIM